MRIAAYHFTKNNNKNNQIQPSFFEFEGEIINARIRKMQIGGFRMNLEIFGVK